MSLQIVRAKLIVIRQKLGEILRMYLDRKPPSERNWLETQKCLEELQHTVSESCMVVESQQRLIDKTLSELKQKLDWHYGFDQIIGHTPALEQIIMRLQQTARTDYSVVLEGETGTGKELFARAIHQNSPRKEMPFLAVPCANLQETLLESELFGHEKGAFTGAVDQHRGVFELCDGGTLLLDDIAEMSLSCQTKLLRALAEKEIRRLGGRTLLKINVRVIATSNVSLNTLVEQKLFRDDLYFRLNMVREVIPPLRERRTDLPLLIDHFLKKFSREVGKNVVGLKWWAADLLLAYHYPGNVRELENIIRYAVLFTKDSRIGIEHLPEEVRSSKEASGRVAKVPHTLEDLRNAQREIRIQLEKSFLIAALIDANGSVTKAARLTGMNRTSLEKMVTRYEIDLADFKQQ